MASTQLSPGVVVLERDLTNVVNATVDNIAAIVGSFEKGPVEQVTDVQVRKNYFLYSANLLNITTSTGSVPHNFYFTEEP